MIKKHHERKTSIELLRIISMAMIIFHHFAIHGGFKWPNSISLPFLWYDFIFMFGNIAVDVFVLITGYFQFNDKYSFEVFQRIIRFYTQVFFYSVLIYVVFVSVGIENVDISSLMKAIFPITSSSWWFASTYFVLVMIHPLINIALKTLSKNEYQKIIIVSLICWSLVPTLTNTEFQGNSLVWFIVLYSIGGFIRRYDYMENVRSFKLILVFLLACVSIYLVSISLAFVGTRYEVFSFYTTYFYSENSITILFLSVVLFLAFVNLQIKQNIMINAIASSTFGIYLIHDNNYVRNFLWLRVFKNYYFQNSILLIPYSILTVIIVFTLCSLIEIVRQIIERRFFRIFKKLSFICWNLLTKLYEKISYLIFDIDRNTKN